MIHLQDKAINIFGILEKDTKEAEEWVITGKEIKVEEIIQKMFKGTHSEQKMPIFMTAGYEKIKKELFYD